MSTQLRKQITDQIIAALEQNRVPWNRPWRSSKNAGRPTSVATGKPYAGVNPILLQLHADRLGFQSRWWGTYQQWKTLRAHPDSVIFLDDADSLFRNLPGLGTLRSALWSQGEQRLVTYNSSAISHGSSFTFTGAVVACANVIPQRNAAFDAVLSRIDTYELDASNAEVIDLMKKIAVNGYGDELTATECLEVVNFIAEFASTRELSLRLLEPSFKKVIYSRQERIDWQDLVRSQLEQIGLPENVQRQESKDSEMKVLEQVLNAHPDSAKDQVDSWCRVTGKSRPTFYRLLKAYRESSGSGES